MDKEMIEQYMFWQSTQSIAQVIIAIGVIGTFLMMATRKDK